MRFMLCLTLVASLLAAPVAMAQGGGDPGLFGQPQPPAAIESTVLPDLQLEGVPLDDAMQFLREQIKGFNVTIMPLDGADLPTLPSIRLKNVSLGQVLELIRTSVPGVDINRIDGEPGPVYVVRVVPPRVAYGAIAGGGFAAPQPATQQNVVVAYKLSDIIRHLTDGDSDPGKVEAALNDTLSLLQAALEEDSDKSTLKVHPATQVLLFRGSPAKHQVVEQVLNTLRPEAQTFDRRISARTVELQRQLLELEQRSRILQDQFKEFEAAAQHMDRTPRPATRPGTGKE